MAARKPKPSPFGATPGQCAAVYLPASEIFTDERRFQNRVDAFSEQSARSVAENYDPNKLDPIVVWFDPTDGRVYVLSGHSRFAGLRKRNEPFIPVRFFEGTEDKAIQFARVDANRAASAESFIEDLKAYKLMRDGDAKAKLKPATKKELAASFKGKVHKLELWSYLDPNGLFVQVLGEDDRSQYPFIETKATYAGEIRRDHPELTNLHERELFNFLYSDKENLKLDKDKLFEIVDERIRLGKEILFPECKDRVCEKRKDVMELMKSQRERIIFKEITELEKDLKSITDRLKTERLALKVHTPEERELLRELAVNMRDEISRLRRDLNLAEKEANLPALFGTKEKKKMAVCSERNALGEMPAELWPQPEIEHRLANKLRRALKSKGFTVVIRYVIDPDDLNSKVPDVVIYKTDRKGNPTAAVAFIEVEQTAQIAKINQKVIELVEQYNVQEAATYDFELMEWHVYHNGKMIKKKSGIKIMDVNLPKDWNSLPE